jgi:urease accessory protein UreG
LIVFTFYFFIFTRVLTNDIFIPEDRDFLQTHKALPNPSQIVAIETGGCPHAAIREDVSANLAALEKLQNEYHCDLLLVESGGDNLAGPSFTPFRPIDSRTERRESKI